MNRLRFEFEWEDPAAAVGPELRATWAYLRIFVDEECLTEVHDQEARSVRTGIYLPLYPLAEWVAMHWWHLFAELENPRRTPPEDYLRRHNLRHGRDGFAFPDMVFRPLNGQVDLSWGDCSDPARAVRFLADGRALLSAEEIERGLQDLVETVVRRLDQSGLRETPLHEEWRAVSGVDAEERSFCMAAAALGLDPYDLDADVSAALLEVDRTLPEPVTEDFFASADAGQLLPQARKVAAALRKAAGRKAKLEAIIDLRRRLSFRPVVRQPWEEGYEWARHLRRELALNGEAPDDIPDIGEMLGVPGEELRMAVARMDTVPAFCEAVVNLNDQGSPGFVLRRQSRAGLKFSFCRALFEYLGSERPGPALVAADYSLRQKRNRAFAAEFLVPAEDLGAALRSDYLDPDDVDALARRFKVSPWLIRHQLENHRLARLGSY